MLETAIYTWVYEKNRFAQTQKSYEISINQQQDNLKGIGRSPMVDPENGGTRGNRGRWATLSRGLSVEKRSKRGKRPVESAFGN